MAGSNSSPYAGFESSRPTLRVVTNSNNVAPAGSSDSSGHDSSPLGSAATPRPDSSTPTQTTETTSRRVLSHSAVGEIWNSHIESMFAQMEKAPASRWIAASPVLLPSGEEAFSLTTQQALGRMMGNNLAHPVYTTPEGSPAESEMDSDETQGQGRPQTVYMGMDGAMDTDSPAPAENQSAATNPQPPATTQPLVTGTAIQPSADNQNQGPSTNPQTTATTQAPPVTGTWIQPYSNPNAIVSSVTEGLCIGLANSGVSTLTDYPLSTSPRMTTEEIHQNLNERHGSLLPFYPATRMESGDARKFRGTMAIKPNPNFQPFSWDSTSQPRTEAARAEGSDENKSPRTR